MSSAHRVGEHSSGLLSAVISTISSTNAKLQEQEKREFERKYDESDAKLDSLLQDHEGQLKTLIKAFTDISDRLKVSKERVSKMKENLMSCKNLLHCKRDELRKFWLDGLEQNTIATMLDHIDELRVVQDQLEQYTKKKLYLRATTTLCDSLKLVNGELREVTALRDIASNLESWKQKLLKNIVDELHHQIYVKSVKGTVASFKRLGSARQSAAKGKGGFVTSTAVEQDFANMELTEDESVDPESDRSKFLAILVECLAKLNEVPRTIKEMRSHLKSELEDVIRRASQQFIDRAYQQGEIKLSAQEQPQYLLELLELVFEQFRCVVHAHNVIIRNIKRVKKQHKHCKDVAIYDITEVWSQIQVVTKAMLEQYFLDTSQKQPRRTKGLLSEPDAPEPTTEKLDINLQFSRRRVPPPRKVPLFSFSGSSHAITLENYLREQREAAYEKGEITEDSALGPQPFSLVCKPGIDNVTSAYKTVENFCHEIEMAIDCDSGGCNLHKYVREFIKNDFNDYIKNVMLTTLKEETERIDHLKNLIDIRRQKQLGALKPLLSSTVEVKNCILRLTDLMQSLPDYCDDFLHLLIKILEQYRDTCKKSYYDVVKVTQNEENTVISASWATDEDISRFLRSLPNWLPVQQSEDSTLAISDEERRSLNLQESKILTTNLSQQEASIASHEILVDPVQLKLIANLHESLEWLTSQLLRYLTMMPVEGRAVQRPSSVDELLEIPRVEEKHYESLTAVTEEFRELCDTCLLLLHLEVRVHCFYHLMPVAQQSNYYCAIDDMDADVNVVKLNKDLTEIEEVMKLSVQPKKFSYIFDGLGHLVASLLINSVQYLKRINGNGVKKMCRNIFAIRQSLTNVTSSRETDLDMARQYYELLNSSMEQVVNIVLEQGAKFTELEYIHLLSLIHRSQNNPSVEQHEVQVQKLKKVIAEKHVYHV